MILALWLGVGLWATTAADGDTTTKPAALQTQAVNLREYENVQDTVGRGSDAQVKLALWCEAHGLSAERIKHLALAVLTDPRNATARGLMGLVDYRGQWQSPEKVSDRVRTDAALAATLAEYNGLRARVAGTADAHWKLALWCDEHGLKAEARAHLVTVTRLDPSRDAAWKRLGLKKQGGRWVSDEQLAEERREAEAQKKADHHWKPLLTKWRSGLHDASSQKRADAQAHLDDVSDPRAVPMIWAVLVSGDATDQAAAVRALARLDGPAAGRALALVAVNGQTSEVKRAAAETLRRRDSRDFIGLLIEMVRKPIKYEVRPVNGPGMPGELFVEGQRADLRRTYMQLSEVNRAVADLPPRLFDASIPFNPYSCRSLFLTNLLDMANAAARSRKQVVPPLVTAEALAARRDQEIGARLQRIQTSVAISQQQLDNDVATLEAVNAEARQHDDQVLPVLSAVTGQDLGTDPDNWRAWWANERGYVYERPQTPQNKPVLTEQVPNPLTPASHHACFAAGTVVRTISGARPIEEIQVGDQVLAQDVRTGRLAYTPVVAVFHNKPAATFKVEAGGEVVSATGIHRFWKAGHGWVMVREIKPGDRLRTIGGSLQVASVESDRTQPVFNLEVGEGTSYFVGKSGLLVHDNSTVWPVSQPFDAPPTLAAAGSGE